MGTKPKYKNEVTMTFRISNDFENRKAIQKVSDKMVVISGYKSCGYDSDHKKNPAINAEIVVFCGDSKSVTETEFSKDRQPKPGDYIDVTGSMTMRSYTSPAGKTYNTLRINATKVTFTEMEEVEEQAYESSESMWG